jgi:hypothetical protein
METRILGYRCLDMQEEKRKELAKKSWKIEEYHRGIKQFVE